MILSHFSVKDWVYNPDLHYLQNHFKPRGLWLSDESDYGWSHWCEDEEFGLKYLESETKFVLADTANVFRLTNLNEVRAFDANDQWQEEKWIGHPHIRQIDWGKLTAQYDGILIAPYFRGWDAVDLPTWYYGWDVPSACVWDLRAITQVSETTNTFKHLERIREE